MGESLRPQSRYDQRRKGWSAQKETSIPWRRLICPFDTPMASPTVPTSLIPTVSIWGPADKVSVVSGVEETPEVEEIRVLTVGFRAALRSLDDVNLSGIFQRTAVVMNTAPHFLRGPFWNAMKVVLEEIIAGSENRNVPRQERAWKAFLFLPRLLLHRRCWGGKIGREKLKDRFEAFRVGDWANLLASSIAHNEKASTSAMRKRCTQDHGDLEH